MKKLLIFLIFCGSATPAMAAATDAARQTGSTKTVATQPERLSSKAIVKIPEWQQAQKLGMAAETAHMLAELYAIGTADTKSAGVVRSSAIASGLVNVVKMVASARTLIAGSGSFRKPKKEHLQYQYASTLIGPFIDASYLSGDVKKLVRSEQIAGTQKISGEQKSWMAGRLVSTSAVKLALMYYRMKKGPPGLMGSLLEGIVRYADYSQRSARYHAEMAGIPETAAEKRNREIQKILSNTEFIKALNVASNEKNYQPLLNLYRKKDLRSGLDAGSRGSLQQLREGLLLKIEPGDSNLQGLRNDIETLLSTPLEEMTPRILHHKNKRLIDRFIHKTIELVTQARTQSMRKTVSWSDIYKIATTKLQR